MKKLSLLSFIFLTVHFSSFSQSFEGVIDFKKYSTMDTSEYVYYVKGDKVRIDEIDSKTKKPAGSFIIDLKLGTMISLSHDRKLYMDQKPSMPATIKGTPEVTKTKNVKAIQGIKCTEYVVKNKDENTQVSYYISNNGKYDFFEKLLKLLNRKDKLSSYYLKITNISGLFPLMAVQQTMDGKETSRIETLKLEKKPLDASLFQIPKGYEKFDK
jgi:hypothetical protein